MAKAQEELNALKEDVETLDEKLNELTDEELSQVTGGSVRAAAAEDFIETSVRKVESEVIQDPR